MFYDGKALGSAVGKPPDDRQIESFSLFKDGISPGMGGLRVLVERRAEFAEIFRDGRARR